MRGLLNYLIIIFVTVISCEKIVDIDIPEKDRKIVINGLFTPDSLVRINVSKSMNILDNNPPVLLHNAIVEFYEDEAFIEVLNHQRIGYYISTGFKPDLSKTYKVKVSVPGLESVEASDVIPQAVEFEIIDTVTTTVSDGDIFNFDQNNGILECTINLTDPKETENYYWLKASALMKYNDPYTEQNEVYHTDIFISGSENLPENIIWNYRGLYFSDELFNGTSFNFSFNFDKFQFLYSDTSTVFISLNSVSKDFYYYTKSLSKQKETRDSPFAQPAQVYNNVKGGYGIFAGYSSVTDTLVVYGSGWSDEWPD